MTNLQGVYAAALTPRRGSELIDQGALWELIDFLCAAHVDGIVLFGSTGEFVHFSVEERKRVIGLGAKRSRVPLLVNVSHSTLEGSVELAQAAESCGAAGLVVLPPYFFHYEQEDLLAFYRVFLREAGVSIPVLLYHIPIFTSPISVDTVKILLSEGYAGVKDSSGSWENFLALSDFAAQHPFSFMMGNDALYTRGRAHGGLTGVISGVAAALPELLVALHRAIESGSQELITRYDTRLQQFIARLGSFPVPAGVREAALARKLKAGANAVPYSESQRQAAAEFRTWLAEWLPEVLKECSHVL